MKNTDIFYKYMNKFSNEKKNRFDEVRKIIHDTIPTINETMWSAVPCFEKKGKKIVLRVFDTHMNIIVDNINDYCDDLTDYVITPKGFLKIRDDQEIPSDILKDIFLNCGERK